MKLGELLSADRVRVPLHASTVSEGFAELRKLLPRPPEGDEAAPPEELGGGDATASGATRLLAFPGAGGPDPVVALGVAAAPLARGAAEGDAAEAPLRILVLAAGKGLSTEVRQRLLACFADPEVERDLLRASDAGDVLAIERLVGFDLGRPLRVEDVMVPLSYRVYPDTPVDEVLDLIARRRLAAVPVVDQQLQVLGVITAADALQHALRRRGRAPGAGVADGPTARQIMTRSVLCVAEDQALLDAAQLMANRETAHLPVVREGEIVGFLTRDGVLYALFGEHPEAPGSTEPSREDDT